MSNLTLTKTRLAHGRWEGRVSGPATGARPDIQVRHLDQIVPGTELSEGLKPGQWELVIPVPTWAIGDGIQTFVILDGVDGTKLGEFGLIAGDAAADNLRAEVDLLRAELDMLKRAFRRHCRETSEPRRG
ncbi:hypothetical protein [Sedimentitalea todarodis]|uniref:Uncharacterized protein n=1 Tax=Sedimentitalea todarodis TaxID=1631240 RepID=A0ABU3V9V6_9RHOB|nr:hypothetical protein [Sedimentitalea todarodis]MDU9002958.1 hypothetical protein [Sedimentitalea todarodis]